jgi:hypothetical protein
MAEKSFYLSPGRESKTFVVAFYRFLEVHSRTLVGSKNTCAIRTIAAGGVDAKHVTLWSEQALHDFVRFWDAYKRVYGALPPGRRKGPQSRARTAHAAA